MCKRSVCLVLFACIFGPVAAQAERVEWVRAAYWDSRYTTGWADEVVSALVRDGLEKAGYEILNADQLKAWMDARIVDQKYSVVVFCKDRAPDIVVETRDANCTLRRYLDAGGKIVHYADIPFYNVSFVNYSAGQWADAGAPAVLGFNTAGATRTATVVTLTPAGTAWGLTQTWSSNRAALTNATADLEVLATGFGGNAAAWVKHYVPGDTFRGFVRIWDFDVTAAVRPTIAEIIRVAEFDGGPKITNPDPSDGKTGWDLQLLQWTASAGTVSRRVYVGTDRADVQAADISSPEFKEQKTVAQAFYLPPTPWDAGVTYYWRVDQVDTAGVVWKGDLWSFTATPAAAWAPVPADRATYVAADVTLQWSAGMGVFNHDVYFSADRAAVETRAAGAKKADKQVELSYAPAGLAPGVTYYWCVDEVVDAAVTPGQVWSFTVQPVTAKTDPALIGWWKLDDVRTGAAVDSSGYDHHGTLMNGVQWVEGVAGDALRFDGIDDHVDCGTPAAFNFSGSVSIAAWIRTGVSTSDVKIASNQNNSTGGFKMGVYSNRVELEIKNASNASTLNRSVAGGTTFTPGVWYHVVGVYTLGQSLKTYVNGKLDREATTAEVLGASNGAFKIGRESYAASYHFLGWIDDVRVYNKALSDEEIAQVMHGDPLIASNPAPAHAVRADVLDAAELSWAPGATAAKHNVYFGADREAVKAADLGSPEYKGQQAGTSYSPAGQVAFGGGAYFWRVDEVEADGTTIHKGNVWRFTVPDYLIIDNFESYTNDSPARVFQTWLDFYGYSSDEFFPVTYPGNGTGAGVGHDIWTQENNPFYQRSIVETVFTCDHLDPIGFSRDNFQSMPLYYDNASPNKKYYSEAMRTWTVPQDLKAGGVTDLSLWFKGRPQKFVQNADGSLTASACSGDIAGTNNDYFRYIYKKLDGDGSMIIKVNSLTFTASWPKCGIMIRETLDVASARAHMITLANGRLALEDRLTTGGASLSVYTAIGAVPLPVWLKLERKGNQFTGSYSTDGANWTPISNANGGGPAATAANFSPNPQTITMGNSVMIGLCITSNNANYAAANASTGVAGWGGLTAIAEISDVTTTASVTGDWTVADIGTAAQPNPANDADDLYVALRDNSGNVRAVTWPNGAVQPDWTNWVIPLSQFTGVNTSAVTQMFIGVGNRDNPQADGTGLVYIDDIRVIPPQP